MSPFCVRTLTLWVGHSSFWSRMAATGSRGAQRRFIETFEMFFRAVAQQAKDRETGNIPDLESYIAMRRDTSGCKPCWALIEYANDVSVFLKRPGAPPLTLRAA